MGFDLPLQVHPERDLGASHHSGQEPRTASALHYAGHRCDAQAGKGHRYLSGVVLQDLDWKVPLFMYQVSDRCLHVTGTYPGSVGKW